MATAREENSYEEALGTRGRPSRRSTRTTPCARPSTDLRNPSISKSGNSSGEFTPPPPPGSERQQLQNSSDGTRAQKVDEAIRTLKDTSDKHSSMFERTNLSLDALTKAFATLTHKVDKLSTKQGVENEEPESSSARRDARRKARDKDQQAVSAVSKEMDYSKSHKLAVDAFGKKHNSGEMRRAATKTTFITFSLEEGELPVILQVRSFTQSKDNDIWYRMGRNTPMRDLILDHSDRMGIHFKQIRYIACQRQLLDSHTADELGMQNEDVIYTVPVLRGC